MAEKQTEKSPQVSAALYTHQEIADLHRLPIYEIIELIENNVISYGYYHVRVSLAEQQGPGFPNSVRVNVSASPVDRPREKVNRNVELLSLEDLERTVNILFNKLWATHAS